MKTYAVKSVTDGHVIGSIDIDQGIVARHPDTWFATADRNDNGLPYKMFAVRLSRHPFDLLELSLREWICPVSIFSYVAPVGHQKAFLFWEW
jgi:hypothetical protein